MSEKAIVAAGCFWCYEALFEKLQGVQKVTVGYTGGDTEAPSYEEVSTGASGHAEAIEIEFDPSLISYEKLLEIFWYVHDPTTLNKQGHDVGTQYISAIFYTDEQQHSIAEESKRNAQDLYDDPIVTEIVPATAFYPAEDYHQDYYENNLHQPYCQVVISPKMQKFKENFSELLKKS